MPAGGKGFFDRTWADTFDETRDVATRYSPINLPYGKHVIEIQGRGGRGQPNVIQPGYQTVYNEPVSYTLNAAYQVTEPAYQLQTNYPQQTTTEPAYTVYADHPARYSSEPGYYTQTDYPQRYSIEPSYSVYTKQPATQTLEPAYQVQYNEPASYTVSPAYELVNVYPTEYTLQPGFTTYYDHPARGYYIQYPSRGYYQASYISGIPSPQIPEFDGPNNYVTYPRRYSVQPASTTYTQYPNQWYFVQSQNYPERGYYQAAYAVAAGYYKLAIYDYEPGGFTIYGGGPSFFLSYANMPYGPYYFAPERSYFQAAYSTPKSWFLQPTYYSAGPTTPATYTLQPGYVVYTTYPERSYFQNSYYQLDSVQPGYYTSADVPASYYSVTPAATYYDGPARYTLQPATEYVQTYPNRYYQEPVSYSVTPYPARYTLQPSYSHYDQYPERITFQPAYESHTDYPARYTTQPAYAHITTYPSRTTYYPNRYSVQPATTTVITYPDRIYAGSPGENTQVYVTDVTGQTYGFVAYGTAAPAPGSYTAPAVPNITYGIVYATEVGGVYQTSVQAYVGSGRNNTNAAQKGFINMKYDADPPT